MSETHAEEKLSIGRKELEKMISEEVDKRLKARKEEKIVEKQESSGISRRNFLKKLGLGAAGLGTLGLLPGASAFDIKSTDGLEVFDENSKYLDVNPGGPIEITNADMDLGTNNIKNVGKFNGADISNSSSGTVLISNGDGTLSMGSASGGSSAKSVSGKVYSGDGAQVYSTEILDGQTFEVNKAVFVRSDGTPAPTNCDLVIATLDSVGGTNRETVLSGDGSTVYNNETGSPLGTYTNSSGSEQTVSVIVDNGHFGTGTGKTQDIAAMVEATVS